MASPSTPHYTSSNWTSEQAVISAQLSSSTQSYFPVSGHKDGLGDIMEHISCSANRVMWNHPHVQFALECIEKYPFPTGYEDYCAKFRFREWDMVCEAMLVACRLQLLEPNAFQRFLLGLYIYEHRPVCCCACGLTPGYWCGEYAILLFFFYLILIIISEGSVGNLPSDDDWTDGDVENEEEMGSFLNGSSYELESSEW